MNEDDSYQDDDLVYRLRTHEIDDEAVFCTYRLLKEAADEIESLREQLENEYFMREGD